MASSRKKKSSRRSTKKGASDPLVSMRRKKEVLGLVLMVLALLLSLAFLSHVPADDVIAQRLDFGDVFFSSSPDPAGQNVRNLLGLLGAEISRVMVPGFLGYPVLLLSGLVFAWGFAIFRHHELKPYLYGTGLTLLSAFVLSCLIGWFGQTLQADLVEWGGAVGMGVAGWMQRVFGVPGSLILLLLIVAVTLLLVIDHDVQRSIDRIVDGVHALRIKLETWWEQLQTRRAERRTASKSLRKNRDARRSKLEQKRTEREERLEAERQKRREAEEKAQQERERKEKERQKQERQAALQRERDRQEKRQEQEQAHAASKAGTTSSGSSSPDSSSSRSSSSGSSSTRPASDDDAAHTSDGQPPSHRSPAIVIDADGNPVRRNDLFRDRLHQAADGDASLEAAPSSDNTVDASSADASSDPEDAGPEALGGHLRTQELDLDELEAEFSQAFDDAGMQLDDTDASDEAEDTDEVEADANQVVSPSDAPEPEDEPEAPADDDIPVEAPAAETASADGAAADVEDDVEDDVDDSSDAEADEDVKLEVQERVEEETTDSIDREPQIPEEVEYTYPTLDLLDEATAEDANVDLDELEENKEILLDKLKTYNIEISEIKAVVGPTVTRYEMTPAPGIKVSRIKSLEDDLAMALAAPGIRMIAPIPGKSAVGVEIPNRKRELVRLRNVLGTAKFRDTDMELPIPLGKSIEGDVFLADLTKMPHLLIAGATGSGKSVGLNTLITGLLYACHPSELKFVIIDPKKIELQQYTHLREHFMARPEDLDEAVITDVDQALGVLKSCEKEMESRYDLLSEASVRGIRAYNRKFKEGRLSAEDGHHFMPYVVVVVDELADLMMTAGKEIEGPIARLAQMARAVGIHLVLATQRPSVDVITGLIKANFPSRIAYEVASRVDSRTILDQIGAEGLVGNGDMLFQSGSKLKRLQGPFVSVEEVERIVDYIADQSNSGIRPYTLPSLSDAGHGPDVTLGVEDTDDLFEKGARVIVRRQQGSVSLLQRKLAVGYTRAARIVDQLEEAGIVGPFNGTKARDVLVSDEDELDALFNKDD